MRWAFRRAPHERGISHLKAHNSLLKTGVTPFLPLKTSSRSSEISENLAGSAPLFPNKCSHSNNKFGPTLNLVLSFGFPLKNM